MATINKMDVMQNISDFTFSNQRINTREVYQSICSQLTDYFIRTGIIIVLLYIFFSWFNWWFFKHGYKKIKYDKNSKLGLFIGDLDNINIRIFWDVWIKDKLSKLLIGYIVVVIYFNLRV